MMLRLSCMSYKRKKYSKRLFTVFRVLNQTCKTLKKLFTHSFVSWWDLWQSSISLNLKNAFVHVSSVMPKISLCNSCIKIYLIFQFSIPTCIRPRWWWFTRFYWPTILLFLPLDCIDKSECLFFSVTWNIFENFIATILKFGMTNRKMM